MITKENKKKILARAQQLKKNAPKVTEEHKRQAAELFKKHQEFERSKDRSIENERKGLAKDVAGFVHTHLNGVGQLFNGFGEGKKVVCCLCKEHKGQMHNMKDGQWYCAEHRWFGNLTKEEQEKERNHVKSH